MGVKLFDPTISLGNIITAVSILVILGGALWRLSGRISSMETKVDAMWRGWVYRSVHRGGSDIEKTDG